MSTSSQLKQLQTYEIAAGTVAKFGGDDLCLVDNRSVRDEFHRWRQEKIASIETCRMEWNGAVAAAVEHVATQNGLFTQTMGPKWHADVAAALRSMEVPLHSEVILSTVKPYLRNELITGRMRAYGACFMSENPEFMPSTQFEWPRFPYFKVEPGTSSSLAKEGLILLANPPGIIEDEANEVGAPICSTSYARTPMISVELELKPLERDQTGAVLLNWSFRPRLPNPHISCHNPHMRRLTAILCLTLAVLLLDASGNK